MNYFFVSQRQTYREEHSQGYLWAPRDDVWHHKTMSDVKKGDAIIQYTGEIVGIGVALKDCYDFDRPEGDGFQRWEKQGYKVEVEQFHFITPVKKDSVKVALLKNQPEYHAPLNVNGGVNQGYLFPANEAMVDIILRKALEIDQSPQQAEIVKKIQETLNIDLSKKGEDEPAQREDEMKKSDSIQKIFFGAPGTGKSYTLNKKSAPFDDQKKIRKDKKDEIRNAIAEAITKSGKLTLLNSIGFKYSDELKSIQRKDLSSYCEYDKIDELYIGSNAKPISDEIQIEKDEQLTDIDFIKDLIQNKKGGNDSLKWANAIGFKFGDFLKDWTLDELRKTFELSEPQMWWIYRGAQASQIRSSEIETEIKYVERVTFHPNYSYAQFVGTYKPVQDSDDKKQIKYEYVPGPFMRMYCAAKKNSNNDFLLIIEEINRANVAAVFGDVFQLLDRKNGVSEYPIAASEDIRNFLADNGINEKELCIPSNMYIWATMNSADQGVFPMDTAFKRRWEFEYIGIDENEDGIKDYDVPLQKKEDGSHEWVKWNNLRHSINDKLTEMKINEDKLLGPYFISEEKLKLVEGKNEENAAEFVKSFKSKVLMYLFEDAVKMRPGDLFDENAVGKLRFSDICKKFDEIGRGIFNFKK